jgi:hypothetical protein
MVWCKQSCRRRFRTWQTDDEGSPGTWESPTFAPQRTPGWRYRVTNSWPWLCTRLSGSENSEWTLRYRQAKETKCGEMAVGCRSTRIVLMKPGNWSRWTRWREGKTERGCLMLDPGSGNTSEALNLEYVSPTRPRIAFRVCSVAAWRIHHWMNRMR